MALTPIEQSVLSQVGAPAGVVPRHSRLDDTATMTFKLDTILQNQLSTIASLSLHNAMFYSSYSHNTVCHQLVADCPWCVC